LRTQGGEPEVTAGRPGRFQTADKRAQTACVKEWKSGEIKHKLLCSLLGQQLNGSTHPRCRQHVKTTVASNHYYITVDDIGGEWHA
jgi:hypothetical protein